MKSSCGFHTMTLSRSLYGDEQRKLIQDFAAYGRKTHEIRIYMLDGKNKPHSYNPDADHLPLRIRITFVKYRGISWTIKEITGPYGASWYSVEVTINPKFLAGIRTYTTAADHHDMDVVIRNFNLISRSISTVLGEFSCYLINRIDYCVNLSISELVPRCTYEQIMNLIKRSNVPSRFKEWDCYDNVAHRTKSRPGSFYLTNRSVHINCYSKYMQLLEQSKQNMARGYSPIPPNILEDSKDIIRFEVQCKYIKTRKMMKSIDETIDSSYNKYRELLHPITCLDIITKYYWNTIGRGDWYTLSKAISMIQDQHYNRQKEKRLIDVIRLVNTCRSVSKARETLSGDKLRVFNLTLKDLMSISINPVTIPREWGIPYIRNLLNEYTQKYGPYPSLAEVKTYNVK